MDSFITPITANIKAFLIEKYQNFLDQAPLIFGALAIFILGLLLAEFASWAIIRMSEKLRLETISEKIGLKHFLHRTQIKYSPSYFIAKAVKAYLIFLFFIEATKVAGLTEVADFLTKVIAFVPDMIIALFIVLVGIQIGGTMELIIRTSLGFARASTGKALGIAAKYTVIVFSALAALAQLQIAEILIQILFIGFVGMLTIAGGLAFGLGGKDVVRELLEALKKVQIKENEEQAKIEAEDAKMPPI